MTQKIFSESYTVIRCAVIGIVVSCIFEKNMLLRELHVLLYQNINVRQKTVLCLGANVINPNQYDVTDEVTSLMSLSEFSSG